MATTLAVMALYLIWLFPGVFGPMFAWVVQYSEWAIKLPVMAAVYMILLIVLWIGYTMATTPSPVPLDSPLDLESMFKFEEEGKTEEAD